MNSTDSPAAEPPGSNRAPAPPEAGAALPRRLYRDPHGPIGGVAGGFAGYFGVDPVISRLLWIIALLAGIGFPAYLVCWIVIPKAKIWPPPGYGARPAAGPGQSSTTLVSGVVIIALVAVIGAGSDGIGEYLLPAVLVGFGVYLLNQRPGEPSAASAAPGSAAPASDLALAGVAAPPDATSRPRAGLVTPTLLSVLSLAAGVAAALHAAGIVHVSVAAAAAAGLVLVGVASLASLWLGPARGLVPLGLALAGVMLVADEVERWSPWGGAESAAAFQADGEGAVGERRYAPASLAELEPEYTHGIGKLTLDLSRLDVSGTTREVGVRLGIGEAEVIVPANAALELRGDVGVGSASMLGEQTAGLGASVSKTADDQQLDAGKLIVDVEVGIGEGRVRRAGQ